MRGGCCTAIISPEGQHLAEPLRSGEGMVIADLDFSLITKRKRMMDSVGHYARPELLSLKINNKPAVPMVAEDIERPDIQNCSAAKLLNSYFCEQTYE